MKRIALPQTPVNSAIAPPAAVLDPIDADHRTPVRPTSRWHSLEATMAHFAESCAETVEQFRETGDLRAQTGERPASGNLDAIGWARFLSRRTELHTLQIEEIEAEPGSPAG